MGYKDLLSYSSTIATPCSLSINENTSQRFLNLGSNIKENRLWVFISSDIFKKEKKDSNTTHISFLMLNAKNLIDQQQLITLSSIFVQKAKL
jgi:hypothetical protein